MNIGDKLKINVAQEEINSGNKCEGSSCPVTLSIYKDYPKFDLVTTSADYIDCTIGSAVDSTDYIFKIPEAISSWIKTFDCNGVVSPIQFEATLTDIV